MPCGIPVASRVEFVRGLRAYHQQRPVGGVQPLRCHNNNNNNNCNGDHSGNATTVFDHIAAAAILCNADDDDNGSPPAADNNLLIGVVVHFILGAVLANPGLIVAITGYVTDFATIAAMDVLGRLHDAAALGSGLLCSAAVLASNYARRGSSAAFRRGWGLRWRRQWVQQRHGE